MKKTIRKLFDCFGACGVFVFLSFMVGQVGASNVIEMIRADSDYDVRLWLDGQRGVGDSQWSDQSGHGYTAKFNRNVMVNPEGGISLDQGYLSFTPEQSRAILSNLVSGDSRVDDSGLEIFVVAKTVESSKSQELLSFHRALQVDIFHRGGPTTQWQLMGDSVYAPGAEFNQRQLFYVSVDNQKDESYLFFDNTPYTRSHLDFSFPPSDNDTHRILFGRDALYESQNDYWYGQIYEVIILQHRNGESLPRIKRILLKNHLQEKWDVGGENNALNSEDYYDDAALWHRYSVDVNGVGRVDDRAELNAQSGQLTVLSNFLQNGQFLLLGHNGASGTTALDIDGESLRVSNRMWHVDVTGEFSDSDRVSFSFRSEDLSSLLGVGSGSLKVLYDSDGDEVVDSVMSGVEMDSSEGVFTLNSMSADALRDQLIAIGVVVNEKVTVNVSTDLSTDEDKALIFNDVSGKRIRVSDAEDDQLVLSISVSGGELLLRTTSGLTGDLDGGDGTLTLNGKASDIDEALDGLVYAPVENYSGDVTLSVLVDGEIVEERVIRIDSVNDAPQLHLPGQQSLLEDSPLTFGSENALSIVDVDGEATVLDVNITVSSGRLTLSTNSGLDGDTDGHDGVLSFSGTVIDINQALNGMVYTPFVNFDAEATMTLSVKDKQGGEDTGDVLLLITGVNDQPSLSAAGTPMMVGAGDAKVVTGIAVSDIEENSLITLEIEVIRGQLSVDDFDHQMTGDLDGSDGRLVLRATSSILQAALDSLVYSADVNFGGDVGVSLKLSDGDYLLTAVRPIFVSKPIGFGGGSGRQIVISDIDGDAQTVTLIVTNGRLVLGNVAGLAGDMDGADGQLQFRGSLRDVNVALATLLYYPDIGFNGVDLMIHVDDGYQGVREMTYRIEAEASAL